MGGMCGVNWANYSSNDAALDHTSFIYIHAAVTPAHRHH